MVPLVQPADDAVLVVDDGPLNRRLVSALLESIGYRVTTASSGEEGVAKALATTYGAVFMDLHMPDLDGRTASIRIRTAERAAGRSCTPIIALSADDRSGEEPSFDAYLTKPATVDVLGRVLRELAARSVALPPRESLAPELVDEFLATARGDATAMGAALARGDFAAIEHIGHGLKGTGGAFGFPILGALGAQIQELATRAERKGVESCIQRLVTILEIE